MRALIDARLDESCRVHAALAKTGGGVIGEIGAALLGVLERGHALYLVGNGGSAADAQHLAAELQGRLYLDRRALPVMALTTNSSTLTAIANDSGYDQIFSRQVEAQVKRGDALWAISTSGRSGNVLAAAKAARRAEALVIGFTGRDPSPLDELCDLCFHAPSDDVARIQECHETAGHILCELLEAALFPRAPHRNASANVAGNISGSAAQK
jgi:D-sedoheptulose 7-phosphate isomerase